MGKVINLYGDRTSVILSTGTAIDMQSTTIKEEIDAFDNLLSATVMEHFANILKISTSEGNYDCALDILQNEVDHLVDNVFIDHKMCLKSILTTLLMQRFGFFITNVLENQEKKTKKQTRKKDK